MRLKRLELVGFKSFANRVCLEFGDGITAIVGPNGSGKSNISDAVRWVLGEQSARSLRGSKMEDVIFSGTDGKRPLGMAEVQLTLDNSEGYLPIDYSEVTVTRRVFRSGDSEFLINNRPCRLKDIHDLFTDTGLGREGYAIIGQGQIDTVLSVRSQDRRVLLEETAGIIKYRHRKEEALAKMEKTNIDLMRVSDISHELEQQLEPLSKEAEKARKYHELMDELLKVEMDYYALVLQELDVRGTKAQQDYDKAQSELKIWNTKCNTLAEKVSDLQKELDDINTELENRQAEQITLTEQQSAAHQEVKLNEERLRNNAARSTQLSSLIQDKSLGLKELQARENQLREQAKDLGEECRAKEELIAQTEDALRETQEEYEQSKVDLEALKNDFLDFMRDLADARNFQRNFHNEEQNLKVRIEASIAGLQAIDEELAHSKQSLLQLENAVQQGKHEVEQKKQQIAVLNEQHKKRLQQLAAHQEELQALQNSYTQIKSRLRVLEELDGDYEGYAYSVKRLMQSSAHKDLILGTVADVISVPKGLELAFEVALGSSIQNVITETEQDAKRLIEWLRSSRGGRATFLPLEAMRGSEFPDRVKGLFNEPGVLGTGVDLLSFDPKFRPAIASLLGRTAFTEDLDTALSLKSKLKSFSRIVTRDGDVVYPSGAMTGGSQNTRTSGLLTRKADIKRLQGEAAEATARLQDLTEDKEKLSESVQADEQEIQRCKDELVEGQLSVQRLEQQYNQLSQQLKKDQEHRARQKKEQEDLHELLASLAAESETAATRVEEQEQEEQQRRIRIKQLEEHMKSIEEKVHRTNSTLTSHRVGLAELKGQWQNVRTQLNNAQQQCLDTSRIIEQSKQEQQELLIEGERIEEAIAVNKEEISRCQEAKQKSLDAITQLKEDRGQKQVELQHLNSEAKSANKAHAEMERSLYKLEVELSNFESERERVCDLLEERELQPETVKARAVEDDQNSLKKAIDRLRRAVRNLGMVNPAAAEEYDKVKERYHFLQKQLCDLNEARGHLQDVIHEMDKICRDKLETTFKEVRSAFKELFSYLFKGGHGDLCLTEPDSPLTTGIEVMAQPPGKKLQNLLLLSGGERALTAIALLFAIRRVKPTPFCILDEIDAALDDSNLFRFTQMMKEFAQTTQMLTITHRQVTMEAADALYGVTMSEQAVSQIISVTMK